MSHQGACDEANGSVISRSVRQMQGKRNTSELLPLFSKNSHWDELFDLLSHQNDRFFHSKGKHSFSTPLLIRRIIHFHFPTDAAPQFLLEINLLTFLGTPLSPFNSTRSERKLYRSICAKLPFPLYYFLAPLHKCFDLPMSLQVWSE